MAESVALDLRLGRASWWQKHMAGATILSQSGPEGQRTRYISLGCVPGDQILPAKPYLLLFMASP